MVVKVIADGSSLVDAVVFDFDDTLVATNDIFEQAKERFFQVMNSFGSTDKAAMDEFLCAADVRMVLEKGYMAKECFPLALRETYLHFLPLLGRETDESTAQMIENIGWQVYETKPNFIEGALEVLTCLQGKVRLFLLTQGDSIMQQARLDMCGVLAYFDDFRIVQSKNKSAYLAFAADMNIDVKRSWMIGNSLRSDINPALSIGMNAIHYQLPAWDFEHEEPLGEFVGVKNLREVLEVIPYENKDSCYPV